MRATPSSSLDWQSLAQRFPSIGRIPPGLRKLAEQDSVDQGRVLFGIGDCVRSVLCVVSGELRLVRRDVFGREIILQRTRGGFFSLSHAYPVATLI